jgi:flagellar basal-body rod protein FlgF
MNIGLYSTYLGMKARQVRLDLIAGNIANASTTGFKADRLAFRSANSAIKPEAAGNETAVENNKRRAPETGVLTLPMTDFSGGPIRDTGRSLDVALDGPGFLVVQTAAGERYTRSGSLTLDANGQLVTQNGDLVVGEGGPITVGPGEVTIGDDGTISSNGQQAGKLKVVQFNDPIAALQKEGHSLFVATGAEKANESSATRLVQGALETSNVNSLTEMVAMMQNTREFDSLQRSVSMLMNDLGRTIANELGKL